MSDTLQPYLKEKASHGTPEFPIGFYPCLIPEDYIDLPVHWHEELEITRVVSGQLDYTVNMTPIRVREGDLLLIAPDTLHGAHMLSGITAATDSVVVGLELVLSCLSPEAVAEYGAGMHPLPSLFRPGDSGYREMRTCFQRLWECRDESIPLRELEVKGNLLSLIRLFWRLAHESDIPDANPAGQYEDKLKTVLAYIKAHYSEPVPVKELAQLCGYSEVHFMNIFKKTIGTSCNAYIIEYRLAMAAADLRETRESILQVAMDNGFRNISYFNRMFKKKFQMTPQAYRNLRTKKENG